jgi:hypothetical protein
MVARACNHSIWKLRLVSLRAAWATKQEPASKKKKKRKFHTVCPVRHFVVRVPLAFFREGSTGVWTQSLTLARQALYHLSHFTSPWHVFICLLSQGSATWAPFSLTNYPVLLPNVLYLAHFFFSFFVVQALSMLGRHYPWVFTPPPLSSCSKRKCPLVTIHSGLGSEQLQLDLSIS